MHHHDVIADLQFLIDQLLEALCLARYKTEFHWVFQPQNNVELCSHHPDC